MPKAKPMNVVPGFGVDQLPPRGLEEELQQVRLEAGVLRRHGQERQAEAIENFAARVERAAGPFLSWMDEAAAARQSGRSRAWFRARFASWEEHGLARRTGQGREYREVIVPLQLVPSEVERIIASLNLGEVGA